MPKPIDLSNPEVLNDPKVRERLAELGAHAQMNIEMSFCAQHPELLNADPASDVRNREAIHAYMAENNLPLSVENMELAFQRTLEAGLLSLPMYHPAELEAFPRMTTEQLKEHMLRRHQVQRPPNAWMYFPSSGERWQDETSNKTEEQLQELREKLLRGTGW